MAAVPSPPSAQRPHPAVLVVLALATLMTMAVVVTLWHLRRDTLAIEMRSLQTLASASADELERGLQGVLLALQATRDDLREARLQPQPASEEAAAQLHRRASLIPLLRTLWIVDRSGRVLAASTPAAVPAVEAFHPAARDGEADAARVSEPYADLASHETSVAVALRFVGPDGAFGGWVVAQLPAGGLLGAFPAAEPAPDTRLAIYRRDGVRLAGEPAPPDGSERLAARRRIEALSFELVMTRDVDAVLARWRELARIAGATSSGVLLIVAALLWRMLRAERSRRLAQQQLQERMEHSRRLEHKLARTQKLDALGTLAGGVAHDFNNILAAVAGFGDMARQAAGEGSQQARHLDRVLEAAERGKAVVERILTFSRGGLRPATVFSVQPVVEQVLGLLAASAGERLLIERDIALQPPLLVRGDATGLFEAVTNLCTNAMQAMPEGGVLRVSVRACRFDAEHWTSHGRMDAGDCVAIDVADTGRGIAPEIMERLFEPFFTTRGQAGTGLGLAVVHGVVAEFGGAVDVRSRPDEGSTFCLLLPRVQGVPAADAPAGAAGGTLTVPPGRGQRVLVVDDEPALVALAEEWIAAMGYEPVGFSDARLALAELQADAGRFDLLLTDEVMPGLSGTALAQQARRLRADLPVLLTSGYGGPDLLRRAAAAGVGQVLAKPLGSRELQQAIERALQGAAAVPSA
jgi:signal transduction histidine kinase/CheY-like chemotaxis protein